VLGTSSTFPLYELCSINRDYLLVDPTDKEEQVMDGRLIVGVNEHKEICALHLAGGVAILPEQIIRCFEIAASKCKLHTAIIQVIVHAYSYTSLQWFVIKPARLLNSSKTYSIS